MMIRLKNIILILVLLLLLFIVWRVSFLFSDISDFFSDTDINHDVTALKVNPEKIIQSQISVVDTEVRQGRHETIKETMTRLKNDVVVTGVILTDPGQESAIFQIEGMEDRVFNINTQLMDGFIITRITERDVILKNQLGSETIQLFVQSGQGSENDVADREIFPETTINEVASEAAVLENNESDRAFRLYQEESSQVESPHMSSSTNRPATASPEPDKNGR